jgi:hypothetical protein
VPRPARAHSSGAPAAPPDHTGRPAPRITACRTGHEGISTTSRKGSTMDFGNSVQQGFDRFFGFLPNLLGFIVILIVGYIIAKVVAGITAKALEKLGLDRRLHEYLGI